MLVPTSGRRPASVVVSAFRELAGIGEPSESEPADTCSGRAASDTVSAVGGE